MVWRGLRVGCVPSGVFVDTSDGNAAGGKRPQAEVFLILVHTIHSLKLLLVFYIDSKQLSKFI
ncbi:hypothetical protein EON63_03200 [archaeon]|nr:MAG: hypothetical protein EON63_03200 [archaeon]